MLKLRTKSITTQIIIVTVCLALVPILFLGWYANGQKIREISTYKLLHMQAILQNMTNNASFKIEYQKNIVKTLASAPILINSLEKGEKQNKELVAFLSFYQTTHNYENIYIFKDLKNLFLDKNSNKTNFNYSSVEKNLNKTLEKTYRSKSVQISDLIQLESSGKSIAFLTSPILKDEKILGFVAVSLDEDFFIELLSIKTNLGKTSEIIASKRAKDNSTIALLSLKDDTIILHKELTHFDKSKNNSSPEVILEEKGFGEIKDHKGDLVLAAWDLIPSLGWNVQIKVDKKEVLKNIHQSNRNILILIFGAIIGIMLLAIYSSRLLAKPLLHLVDSIKRFSKGEQLCVLSGSSYEITLLSKTFNEMSDKINSNLEILKNQARTIDKHNQTLETQILKRTKDLEKRHRHIAALLDNSGQGFLSCDKSLHIRTEYSKECETLFDLPISGTYLPKRLFEDKSRQEAFEKTLASFFQTKDPFQQEALLSLLDTKTRLGNHEVSIEYKPLEANSIMLIITNVSEICELEAKLQDERQMLSFITTALKDKRQFFDTVEAFETELEALYSKVKKEKKLSFEQIQIFYRKIHTYKGVFLQYALPNLPQVLHSLESDLFKKLSNHKASLDSTIEYFNEAIKAKNKDISILTYYLGEDFIMQKEVLNISATEFESLEAFTKKVQIKLGDSHSLSKELKELIKNLRLVPLRSLLIAYPNLALHLATSMEKEIEPFDIIGGEFLVDPHHYSGFTKALIHLFNNAIDHGIEPIDERLELGKPAAGILSCTITQVPGFFHLQLNDDGRGLDVEIIKEKAKEKGMKVPKELSDKDACLLIFNDDFSLKKDVTQISGRGVGLSALKAETEALGGTVSVTSILGYGSTFCFKLPYTSKEEL